jgi:hypothetical protein
MEPKQVPVGPITVNSSNVLNNVPKVLTVPKVPIIPKVPTVPKIKIPTSLGEAKQSINTVLGSRQFNREKYDTNVPDGMNGVPKRIQTSDGRWTNQDAAYNPLYDATKALEDATYVEGAVKYINIIYAASVILKWISMILYNIFYYIALGFYTAFKSFITNLPLNMFMISVALVGVFCYIFADTLWQYAILPSINGLIQGYNGAVGVWNDIAKSVAHIGFPLDFGTLGNFYVDIGGIPLPMGKEMDPIIKSFGEFCWDILMYIFNDFIMPVKEYIFR